jgi:hypothetical protein
MPYQAARARFVAEIVTLPLMGRAQRNKALVNARCSLQEIYQCNCKWPIVMRAMAN